MHYYCTLFDINYLPNFLALYHSLASNSNKGLKIYAFCMDDKSFDYLSVYQEDNQNEIICVRLSELKAHFPQLDEISKARSVVEFYFTCSPFICTYVFNMEKTCPDVTYLDADLRFFDSPELIFNEIGKASIAIIEHKFFGWGKRYLKYGRFNVGWVTFKNDSNGMACLASWLNDCAEWCYDYYDEVGQRFGDQKYLDKWERDFSQVKIIRQNGANLAPWNVGQYKITRDQKGQISINKDPLVFYHYASFKKVDDFYTTSVSRYMTRPSVILKKYIYKKYLDEVSVFSDHINSYIQSDKADIMKKNRTEVNQTNFRKRVTQAFTSFRRWYFNDYIYK